MENQTLSIQQMHHLQELGVDTSGASLTWMLHPYEEGKQPELSLRKYSTFKEPFRKEHCIPAFTLQDIIELLPEHIYAYNMVFCLNIKPCGEVSNSWMFIYQTYIYDIDKEFDSIHCTHSESAPDAAYQMLCWCAENGYLKGGEK